MSSVFDPSEQQTFHQLVCDYLAIAVSAFISTEELQRHRAHIEGFFPPHIDGLVLQMHQYVTALGDESINIERAYPINWWQAVRQRWCPAWWLQRYPVQMARISIHELRYRAVCPHLPTDQHGPHLRWLVQEDRPAAGMEVPVRGKGVPCGTVPSD